LLKNYTNFIKCYYLEEADLGNKGREFYEKYFMEKNYPIFLWDVGAWATRKAVRDKVTHRSGRLLELGCGLGIFLREMMPQFECWGMDISSATLEIARKYSSPKINFIQGDIRNLPFLDSFFDVITNSHTLEHIPDDQKVIEEVYRVLKPKGEFIIWVPGGISGKSDRQSLKERGHLRVYNSARFRKLFSKFPDFKIVEIAYMHRIHNLIWNQTKRLLRYPNFIIKLIKRDEKSIYQRKLYQKRIFPFMVRALDFFDSLVNKKEKSVFNYFKWSPYNVLLRAVKG